MSTQPVSTICAAHGWVGRSDVASSCPYCEIDSLRAQLADSIPKARVRAVLLSVRPHSAAGVNAGNRRRYHKAGMLDATRAIGGAFDIDLADHEQEGE